MPDDTKVKFPEDLTGKTVGLTDALLADDGSESYNALVSAVAKTIVEQYAGSQLGGALRSIKSAIDLLNSNTYLTIGGREITANGDLNTDAYCVEGTYHCNSADIARSLQNCPTTTVFRMIAESTSSGASANYKYIRRTIITGTSASNYKVYTQFCYKIGAGASFTFGSWALEPSRSEVDALSSKLTLSSKATSVNAWTNDTNAVYEIVGETKKFSITIASNGTLSGSVTNL